MHVCMSQAAKRVCMYASNIHTYIHSRSQTYIHTLSDFSVNGCIKEVSDRVCMFKNQLPVMENGTYMFEHELSNAVKRTFKNVIRGALKHVCMFENPLHVVEN